MDELEIAIERLKEALEEVERSGSLSARTLKELGELTDESNENLEKYITRTAKTTSAVEKFGKGLLEVTGGLVNSADQVRQSRESFQSLDPAIRATGTAARATGNLLGDLAGGAAAALVSLSGVGALGSGAIFVGVSSTIKGLANATIGLAEQFATFSTAEIDRVRANFQQLGAVGGISADALSDLYDAAQLAGLSTEQFSRSVAQNAQGLAFAIGTVESGAETIANVSSEFEPFRRQFQNLGIGFEQQADFIAESIEASRRAGITEARSYREQAVAAADYIEMLDELSRLTGIERDQVQSRIEAIENDIRFRASLAAASDSAAEGMRETVIRLQAAAPGIAQGFMDALGGNLGTEVARQAQVATGGVLFETAELLKNEIITTEEALSRLQEGVRSQTESLGGFEQIAQLSKLGTYLDPLLLDMVNVAQTQNLAADASRDAARTQKDALETTDGLTTAMNDTLLEMQKLAIAVDDLVADTVLPRATRLISKFADGLELGVSKLSEAADQAFGTSETPTTETNDLNTHQQRALEGYYGSDYSGYRNYYGRAFGGEMLRGQPYVVGEAGPEIVVPQINADVMPSTLSSIMSEFVSRVNLPNTATLTDALSNITTGLASRIGPTDTATITDTLNSAMASFESQLNLPSALTAGPALQYSAIQDRFENDIPEQPAGPAAPAEMTQTPTVNFDNSEMLSKLDQLISISRNNAEASNKILRATIS
mgnify:CR=1 FL=1